MFNIQQSHTDSNCLSLTQNIIIPVHLISISIIVEQ